MVSWRKLSLIATLALMTGCGGGDSGGDGSVSVTPTPTPSPAPSPTPTASAYTLNALPSAANALVGLNQLASFPTIGFQFRDEAGASVQTGIQVGYDAAKTSTTVTLPSYPAGYLDALGPPASGFTRSLLVPTGGIEFELLQPSATNPFLALGHTSVGFFTRSNKLALQMPVEGVLAYGVPTAAGAFPTSGTARFILYGRAFFIEPTEGPIITGFGGELDFDFASRILSGRFVARDAGGFGTSDYVTATFTGGALAADGTFAGTITVPGQQNGTFSGRLTGPAGTELMLEWGATYSANPSNNRYMGYYGVMAGKR